MERSYVLQLKKYKFENLHVCFCGYSQCKPLHSFGPAARANYIIHFILNGKGVYKIGEKKYSLQAGQGFVIEPEVLTFYQADKEEPWSYIWIGFDGTDAEECVKDLGISSERPIFQSRKGKELKRVVVKMIRTDMTSVSDQYKLQSLLYEFLAMLMDHSIISNEDRESKESTYVNHAVSYIRNHYQEKIRVTDLAEYISVSRSYLYKLFQSSLGMSPQEFIVKFRISRARELLTMTEMPIENIALSCGFYDSRAFSKAFKQQYGQPPLLYRKQGWGEEARKLSDLKKEPGEVREE